MHRRTARIAQKRRRRLARFHHQQRGLELGIVEVAVADQGIHPAARVGRHVLVIELEQLLIPMLHGLADRGEEPGRQTGAPIEPLKGGATRHPELTANLLDADLTETGERELQDDDLAVVERSDTDRRRQLTGPVKLRRHGLRIADFLVFPEQRDDCAFVTLRNDLFDQLR